MTPSIRNIHFLPDAVSNQGANQISARVDIRCREGPEYNIFLKGREVRKKDRDRPLDEAAEREKLYRDRTLRCPFCLSPVELQEGMQASFGGTVDGGRCGCGAVFVHDRTGRLLGEAYMDALAMAFGWDYDAALGAESGSYEEAVVRFEPRIGKFLLDEGGRFDRSPKYYFVRRKPRQEGV